MKKASRREVLPPRTVKKGTVFRIAFFLKDKPVRVTIPQLVANFLGTVIGWPLGILYVFALLAMNWWWLIWIGVIILCILVALLIVSSRPARRAYTAIIQFWTAEYQVA